MKLRNISFVLILTGCGFVNAIAASVEEGFKKAVPCIVCHGDKGESTNAVWPKLNGQHVKYLKEQLMEFVKGAKGKRHDALMDSAVSNLSSEDIDDLAAYFAAQKTTLNLASPDKVSLGEKIYKGGNKATGLPACSACHGPKGDGNLAAGFPKLSGQHAKYISIQLQKFKTEKRSNDYNEMMQDIAKLMTDEEIKAVSSYISGLY